jgi:long-chain acyl-CoA synthetase
MFFDKLTSVNPEKIALKLQDTEFTYASLLEEIDARTHYFLNHRADYLLSHHSILENLVNFLALIKVGQKGVFASKNSSREQNLALCEKYSLSVLDFTPPKTPRSAIDFRPKNEDVFLGILTSEKRIIWKDYQSWFSAFSIQSEVFKINSDDTVLVLDALAYSANLNAVLHALWSGATVVLTRLSDVQDWHRVVKREKVSSIFMVPSHLRLFADNNHFSEVKSVVTAGEKVDPMLAKKMYKLFPQACFTEYYGTPELGHISYIQDQDIIQRLTSVGKAFPGVSIRISENKIAIDSLYVSPEYRINPTVNDIGFLDKEGYLTLLGRDGQFFNRRKVNTFAEELDTTEVIQILFVKKGSPTVDITILFIVSPKISQDKLNCFLISRKPVQVAKKHYLLHNVHISPTSTSKVNFKIFSKRPVEEDFSRWVLLSAA